MITTDDVPVLVDPIAIIAERETSCWWWTGHRAEDHAHGNARAEAAHRAAHPACFPTQKMLAERRRQQRMRARAAFVEDIAWLLDSGCGWHEISRRTRLAPAAIARRLQRERRPDLAAPFETAVLVERTAQRQQAA